MKRSLAVGGFGSKKRAKNLFSLKAFGHDSLQPSARACAGHLSADGRRADVQVFPIRSEGSTSVSDPSLNLDDDWEDVLLTASSEVNLGRENSRCKRKWYATTDDNLRHWVNNYRDAYLRVLITREGLMGAEDICQCGEAAKYRCGECYGGQMFCRDCIVEVHRLRPLCRIQGWNGRFFERRELRKLGLRVQLGHPDNQPCPRAHRGRDKFVVIAPNGFHHVAVDFCQCRRHGSQQHWEQLLMYGWFPSTPDNPQSTITISTLKIFHAVSLQGKTTVYHFFTALARITDNTGSEAFKRRYQLALRVVHQWRNLRALKRGGMGNDPDRATAETRDGELAVDCLACPKAGVNLPAGWEKTPQDQRYLYAIFLAIDACFRLKRKKVSSWAADPSIQDGWAYFVPSADYMKYVETLGDQKEMSTCTGLSALDHANTKYSHGYAATGCGMVTCGRHEIVAKNGVGDLQNGEKYGNTDYILASAWRHFLALIFFLLSYDIMCQWSKNFRERFSKLPSALRLHLVHCFIKFVIPKLHILGHLKFCQDNYSLLYTLGAAQADMEGIDRIWSSSGLMGASTREMGPGSRQNTLDDFWHHWNWNKVVGMGSTLRKRFLKATKELAAQKSGLEEFSRHHQEEVPIWRKAVDDFERGASAANPYELPKSGAALRDIELELMREEQTRELASAAVRDATEETMTEYLMLGLEIEGQQRQLSADLLANRSPTAKELTDFVTRRTRISRQIKKLRLLQRKYSPSALQHLATSADPTEAPEAERAALLLPSALSRREALPPLSAPGLAEAEARLRDGQCGESLDQIRHGLTVKRRLQTYKALSSRHQHQNTRARGIVDGQQRRVDLAAGTYRQAQDARLALTHVAGEEAKKKKQRAMKSKRKEAAQVNENGDASGNQEGVLGAEMHAGVKVEWCKAYARVKRWREEVLLLQEEMARCLLLLEWQAAIWDKRATPDHYTSKIVYRAAHLAGATAFAARQASLRRKLANRFRRSWWTLSSRISGADVPPSSASSGMDEEDGFNSNGIDSEHGSDAGEPHLAGEEEGPGEGDERGSIEGNLSSEEITARTVEMDELLAIQMTSMGQYDDV
ncbi:hypothetical protein K438DRAFT_1996294 [Mycena galopus ATCC 62051]|nr:hypothetical protein K438DRAFT_1996294 [Mycena galopus ATCC 62051]